MEHAAKNWEEGASAQHLEARLHLLRGSSPRATWYLEDAPGGTSISVGAHPDCDWQIRAACVPPHAISLLLLSGNLFVRSSGQGDVLLDGRPLGDSWVAAADGAHLDVGLARLSIGLGPARSAFGRSLSVVSFDDDASAPVRVLTTPEQKLSTATRLEFPAPIVVPARQPPVVMAARQPPVMAPRQPEKAAAEPVPQLGDRPSRMFGDRPSRGFAPSLLEEERPSSSGAWFYVLVGLATLFAYAGWVLALDRL